MKKQKIVVVGTGYVGLPAALMWARAGHEVVGVDIDENVVRAINDGTMIINEQKLQELLSDPTIKRNLMASPNACEADVFVIAVPTPIDSLKKICDLSAVRSAVETISPHLRQGNLVILESTVPPTSSRKVVRHLIEKQTGLTVPGQVLLAHCPERILPGDVFREIVENDRLIGGMDERSSEAAAEIYSAFVQGKLHRTDDLTAELSKLMENTYRDVNIALANEFSQICELLGVDVRNAIGFANKHPRVNILSPGIGVGGHCIPVDPWFLKEAAPYNSRLITAARLLNDEMPDRIAAKIRRAVADIPEPRILALGATYKKNCEDTRESPGNRIVQLLVEDGYAVSHFDPLVKGMNYTAISESAKGVDLVAVLVCHDVLKQDIAENRTAMMRAMRHDRIVFFDE